MDKFGVLLLFMIFGCGQKDSVSECYPKNATIAELVKSLTYDKQYGHAAEFIERFPNSVKILHSTTRMLITSNTDNLYEYYDALNDFVTQGGQTKNIVKFTNQEFYKKNENEIELRSNQVNSIPRNEWLASIFEVDQELRKSGRGCLTMESLRYLDSLNLRASLEVFNNRELNTIEDKKALSTILRHYLR